MRAGQGDYHYVFMAPQFHRNGGDIKCGGDIFQMALHRLYEIAAAQHIPGNAQNAGAQAVAFRVGLEHNEVFMHQGAQDVQRGRRDQLQIAGYAVES